MLSSEPPGFHFRVNVPFWEKLSFPTLSQGVPFLFLSLHLGGNNVLDCFLCSVCLPYWMGGSTGQGLDVCGESLDTWSGLTLGSWYIICGANNNNSSS